MRSSRGKNKIVGGFTLWVMGGWIGGRAAIGSRWSCIISLFPGGCVHEVPAVIPAKSPASLIHFHLLFSQLGQATRRLSPFDPLHRGNLYSFTLTLSKDVHITGEILPYHDWYQQPYKIYKYNRPMKTFVTYLYVIHHTINYLNFIFNLIF